MADPTGPNLLVVSGDSKRLQWLNHHVTSHWPDAQVTTVPAGESAALNRLIGEHTPAATAGVKTGDEIIAVDGVAAKQMSGDDWFHKITQAPGTILALTLRRDGAERQATLTLRELLP